jgi:HK97 family phage prohead protease
MSAPEPLRFAGYAALFGKPDACRDVIRPGAFARTLADRADPLPLYWQHRADPLPLYWQHRADLRIGWVETVAEDARGLRVVAVIDNPVGAAGLALRRGTVTGLSFGYRARSSRRIEAGRELLDVDLFEVSLVTHPMQHGSRVHLIA